MHICAFCYILNIFGVVVLHRSMADERRGGVRLPMGICAFCYI